MQPSWRLIICDIPGDETVESVAARIRELLPGVEFDADHAGVFKRANYSITFNVAADGSQVDVTLDHVDGFTALKRITSKTSWQVADLNNMLVDLDASRAHGDVQFVVAQSATPEPPAERPIWLRWLVRAAAVSGVAVVLWFSWIWSLRPPAISTPPEGTTLDSILSGPTSAGSSDTPGGDAVRRARLREQLYEGIQRARVQMQDTKLLAPEFRGNPAVHQLLEYSHALTMFRATHAQDRFLPPERLAERTMPENLQPEPLLPARFKQPIRDGYAFETQGESCSHPAEHGVGLENLCDAITYVARPVDASADAHMFAFLTKDFRIHHRSDGVVPTFADPTVDNTTPSSASDTGWQPVSAKPLTKDEAKVKSALERALQPMLKVMGFASTSEAAVGYRESDAIRDLRAVASAEQVFSSIEAGFYASPERLADVSLYRDLQWQPPLPGYFVQPLRQGYRFEFVGSDLQQPYSNLSRIFGPVYGSYAYAAIPVDPGPPGRRSFAIYPDGTVYVTSEKRVPTRNDQILRDLPGGP